MPQTKEANLYEVLGRVRDDGRIYDIRIHENCGGVVSYLPGPDCNYCGKIQEREVIRIPQTEVSDYRARFILESQPVGIQIDAAYGQANFEER